MPRKDPFFEDQPEFKFIEELRSPLYKEKLLGFGEREPNAEEIDARGVYIDFKFPDEKGVLETAVDDFNRFIALFEIKGDKYPISFEFTAGYSYESYRIIPTAEGCRVLASDTEGIRRAFIYIEDEFIAREGAFFGKDEIYRTPSIRTRITRGFFSPTNRPPKNGDELFDDIDYYPEEYLNRIAHDGTNALWIYTSFRALLKSAYFPEYGEGSEKRIAKLDKVIKKCARYGIKVYVFAMEPMNLQNEMADNHPEMLGGAPWVDGLGNRLYPVCPMSEAGKGYLLEATEKLFRTLPDLGGYMCITCGERLTSCASSTGNHRTCPRCSKYTQGEALAISIDIIKEGIRRAGTGAEFISWTYNHRAWKYDEIERYVKNAPDDIMLMQNFDDAGYEEQLGKTREAMDYWLSYVGPSQMFRATAEAANKYNKHLYAKMQVCCSHELATVPYIPAPGIIFDKYKAAHEYKVEGVLQCWYFGNYPSIMSKAAGELSFCHDFSDKAAFIKRLAEIYCGKTRAAALVEAWNFFEAGYVNYPINIMFSYYGPMHDGVVWELKLKPENNSLSRSWQLYDRPEGDRIYECLWQGHTLDEAIILAERILESWKLGMRTMDELSHMEIYTVARVLEVLFASGLNILRFYKLRDMLGCGEGDAKKLLSEMEAIVRLEIENSRKAKELCIADCRLGYHSEAEGFKFFPKKLDSRIAYLENLLKTDFEEVRGRIEEGKAPLEYYLALENGKISEDAYILEKCDIKDAKRDKVGTMGELAASYDDEHFYLFVDAPEGVAITANFSFKLFEYSSSVRFVNKEKKLVGGAITHQSVFGDKLEKELSKYEIAYETNDGRAQYLLKIKRTDCDFKEDRPMRMSVRISDFTGEQYLWRASGEISGYLGKNDHVPGTEGWLIPRAFLNSNK